MRRTKIVCTLGPASSDQEQIDAYKRSMAAEWDRNSTLIPLATDKNGKVTDFYNFSYTNPYDYVGRPAAAVFNAVNNGITKEEELSKIASILVTELMMRAKV